MNKPTSSLTDLKSKAGQAFPYALFGLVLFVWVSSTPLNRFFAAYIVLLVAQLGTLGIYLLSRQLKSKDSKHTDLKNRPS
jgi:hypothetical protein